MEPGYDIAGAVETPGRLFDRGQMVMALTVTGGYSQYMNIAETELVAGPEGIDPAEAVCLVLNYITAWQLLHRAAAVTEGSGCWCIRRRAASEQPCWN